MAFQNRNRTFRSAEPKSYPAAVTFHRDQYDFDLVLADAPAYKAFFANVRNLDGATLKAIAAEGNVTVIVDHREVRAVNTDGLRASLTKGAEWREPRIFEPDGPETTCMRCGDTFQPVVIPWQDEESGASGEGGNYRTAKAEELDKLPTEVQAQANELTTAILLEAGKGGIPEGLTTRVIALDQQCRLREFKSGVSKARFYRTREGIVSALFERDAVITAAVQMRQRRDAFDNAFTRRPNRRDHNERPELVEWHGVRVEPKTAEALNAAVGAGKLDDSAAALAATPESQLIVLGIVPHDAAASAVLRRARAAVHQAGGGQTAPRYESPMMATIGEVNFHRPERGQGKEGRRNKRR